MRIYAAEELIHILSRAFSSDIDLALEKAQRLMTKDVRGNPKERA